MNKTKLFAIISLLLSALAANAVNPGIYKAKEFTSSDGFNLLYREAAPDSDATTPLPLILLLHGSGERGDDNLLQLTHGGDRLAEAAADGRAIVIFPQCPQSYIWAYDSLPRNGGEIMFPDQEMPTAPMVAVKELIDSLVQAGRVDPSRTYLSGISMGGMAVWDMIARWPEFPAAAAIMCGAIDPKRLEDICSKRAGQLPIRIFHGGEDDIVPTKAATTAAEALNKCGWTPEVIIFPGVAHDCWVNAFAQDDFIDWMLQFSN